MLGNAVKIIFSRPLAKTNPCPKLAGRKILLKNAPHFQFEARRDNRAFHENISLDVLAQYFEGKMAEYKQADIWRENGEHFVVFGGKNGLRVHKTKGVGQITAAQAHDNEKKYILKEGENIPFLRELGVFNQDFRVIKGMYSKFRQINNFVELIDTAVRQADLPEVLRVADIGCGNSYLTFALHYYFSKIRKMPAEITGIDRQADIIGRCAALAQKYGYDAEGLSFQNIDIEDYVPKTPPNVVVSLHGCNTATDFAVYKGIKWDAALIFVAPCCQHEINAQIKRDNLGELYAPLRYGVLKDRFCALLTDGLRANILEIFDYKVDMAEFVGFNHSPKNILIRATKSAHDAKYKQILAERADKLIADFNINPTLRRLLEA